MRTTINIKNVMKLEVSCFKSRKDIYAPNLQISEKSIDFLREVCEDFARNLVNESLKDVNLNSRLMPEHINKVIGKRLEMELVDRIIPKPRNLLKKYGSNYLPKKGVD